MPVAAHRGDKAPRSPQPPATSSASQEAAPSGVKSALRGQDFGAQEALLAPPENANAKPGAPRGQAALPLSVAVDGSSFERWVQSALSGLGTQHGFVSAPLEVNGKLGAATRPAVKAFQRAAPGLVGRAIGVDGVVGEKTTSALEEATSSKAPSVREKDRAKPAKPPTPGPATPGTSAATGGQGGSSATGGGASATAAAPREPGVKPSEAPKNGTEKQRLERGDEADKAEKPGAARPGQAGKADVIRHRFGQGVIASLTIPAAYDSLEEVIEYVDDGHALDGYAYDQNLPRWAKANPGSVQGYWARIRASSPKLQALPEQFAGAGEKLQGKIIAAVKANKSMYGEIKTAMWADPTWKRNCATTALKNNRFIPDAAESFAKTQGAVDGQSTDVKIGGSMVYNKPAEMGALVNSTSANVRALLEANPPAEGSAPDQTARDEAASKIRFLTVSAHGWPTGMGGHGHAKDAVFSEKKVPGIIASMAGSLSSDVRVRLFACQTSHVGKGDDSGEGSLADVFRDELLKQGKDNAAVIGHTESGHSQENSTTRFFAGDAEGEKHADWRAKSVFDDAFARSYLAEVGAKVTPGNVAAMRDEMRRFFSRECWMGDISSLEALKASSRQMWRERFPDFNAIKGELKDKKQDRKR